MLPPPIPPVDGSTTSPNAFTTAHAPTTVPPPASEAVPNPPFIARPAPRAFPTVAPVPAPAEPEAGGRDEAAAAASYPIDASGRRGAAGEPEVVQDRRGNDRHDPPGRGKPGLPLLEEADHPGGRLEPEGAAPREHEGVDPSRGVGPDQGIHLPRSGGFAADVGRRRRAPRKEEDRYAGSRGDVLGVPRQDPLDIRDRSRHPPSAVDIVISKPERFVNPTG